MVELGYGVAYRTLDARHFGVPQRRQRIFIVGLRSGPDDPDGHLAAERAAAVLSVGARCDWHPATGGQPRAGAAPGARIGLDFAGGLTRRYGKGINSTIDDGALVVEAPDAGGVRAPDGLAGRLDHRDQLAPTRVGPAKIDDGGPGDTVPVIVSALGAHQGGADVKHAQAGHLAAHAIVGGLPPGTSYDGLNQKVEHGVHRSLRIGRDSSDFVVPPAGAPTEDDPLLPLGLDSHRWRCVGNGVVSSVAEWVGRRLLVILDDAHAGV
jgi:hypothetical protein